jgi:hypothetical protein
MSSVYTETLQAVLWIFIIRWVASSYRERDTWDMFHVEDFFCRPMYIVILISRTMSVDFLNFMNKRDA